MTKATDTREQIIDRAGELLMQRGFSGFSYRDISTHLGVKNAAVHYHFPGKADLAVALVDEYRQVLRRKSAEFMAYGGKALPQLQGLFDFTTYQCGLGRCICPVGAFSVDYQDLPESVREAISLFMEETVAWLTRVLETGREQSEFRFDGDAESRALSILAAIQGARQMARIKEMDTLSRVIDSIRLDLGINT